MQTISFLLFRRLASVVKNHLKREKNSKKNHFFPLPPAPSPGYPQDPDPHEDFCPDPDPDPQPWCVPQMEAFKSLKKKQTIKLTIGKWRSPTPFLTSPLPYIGYQFVFETGCLKFFCPIGSNQLQQLNGQGLWVSP